MDGSLDVVIIDNRKAAVEAGREGGKEGGREGGRVDEAEGKKEVVD